ncbi:MAG: hypothetical protein ACTSWQ_09280 [Candidatus Thorarchaeota archaeon]
MFGATLEELLHEPAESFPSRSTIKILQGRTLVKTGTWHKAIVLIDMDGKKQLRLYGWNKNKENVWKVRQKFNISRRYAAKLAHILDAFATEVK